MLPCISREPSSVSRTRNLTSAGWVFWTHVSELVVFSSYEVEERTPYLGEMRARIGGATWKHLDCTTVEVSAGGKV
jgi:hypothetical protein